MKTIFFTLFVQIFSISAFADQLLQMGVERIVKANVDSIYIDSGERDAKDNYECNLKIPPLNFTRYLKTGSSFAIINESNNSIPAQDQNQRFFFRKVFILKSLKTSSIYQLVCDSTKSLSTVELFNLFDKYGRIYPVKDL